MEPKLLTRDDFREGVFKRDNYKCVFCDQPAQDAHHILERRLWPDGGYYAENGASVCGFHHLECERTTISVEEVRSAAGISKIWVPPHLYDDHIYDKWGNPVLEDGRRGKGELFFDESVQKVLNEGGVLDLFTPYVKYGRTNHLPWSPGITDDDRVLKDTGNFYGREVVITLKLDGENTNMYRDHIHARSIDSRGGEDRAWVKNFWSSICYEIPEGWRICGENMWAQRIEKLIKFVASIGTKMRNAISSRGAGPSCLPRVLLNCAAILLPLAVIFSLGYLLITLMVDSGRRSDPVDPIVLKQAMETNTCVNRAAVEALERSVASNRVFMVFQFEQILRQCKHSDKLDAYAELLKERKTNAK